MEEKETAGADPNGDLAVKARAVMMKALTRADELLDHPDKVELGKAVHAASQAAANGVKIHEATKLQARIEALEARLLEGGEQ